MSRRLLSGRMQVQALPGVLKRGGVLVALQFPKLPDLVQPQAPLFRGSSKLNMPLQISQKEHIRAKGKVPGLCPGEGSSVIIKMADVAQWPERLVVAQENMGSNPTIRPLAARLPSSCRGVHLR
jgi:hypothetical protein